MNSFRSAILLLVYSITLLTVPVSARSYAFVATSAENTEKEVVTNSTFEHRESSSIKVTGKLTVSKLLKSSGYERPDDNYNPGTLPNADIYRKKVPISYHALYLQAIISFYSILTSHNLFLTD